MYILLEEVLQILDSIELSLKYFGERTVRYSKEPSLRIIFAMNQYFGGVGEPKW
jgi:hypothetical protein